VHDPPLGLGQIGLIPDTAEAELRSPLALGIADDDEPGETFEGLRRLVVDDRDAAEVVDITDIGRQGEAGGGSSSAKAPQKFNGGPLLVREHACCQRAAEHGTRIEIGPVWAHLWAAGLNWRMAMNHMLAEVVIDRQKLVSDPKLGLIILLGQAETRMKTRMDEVAVFILINGRETSHPGENVSRHVSWMRDPEGCQSSVPTVAEPPGYRGRLLHDLKRHGFMIALEADDTVWPPLLKSAHQRDDTGAIRPAVDVIT
jgi:hypothetical protein